MSTLSLSVAKLVKAAGTYDDGELTVAGSTMSGDDLKNLQILLRKYHSGLKQTRTADDESAYAKKKTKKKQTISHQDKFQKYVFMSVCVLVYMLDSRAQ